MTTSKCSTIPSTATTEYPGLIRHQRQMRQAYADLLATLTACDSATLTELRGHNPDPQLRAAAGRVLLRGRMA